MIGERIKQTLRAAPLGWAFFVSVMVHIVLILLHWQPDPMQTGEVVSGPMQVMLVPKDKPAEPVSLQPEPPKPKKIQKTVKPSKPKPSPKVMAKIADDAPEEFTVPEELAQIPEPEPVEIIPLPEMPPPSSPSAPTDMMSLIKQKREAKAALGDPLAINALEESKLSGQTMHKNVDEIVKQNLKESGTNGIFTVTSLNRFEGTFAFQGWQGEFSNAQRSFYRVETFNPSDDIRVLMVNKMIEIIRSHYSGDFQWQSHRLGDFVTLSARPKDDARLVMFLLTEFQIQFDQFLYYH